MNCCYQCVVLCALCINVINVSILDICDFISFSIPFRSKGNAPQTISGNHAYFSFIFTKAVFTLALFEISNLWFPHVSNHLNFIVDFFLFKHGRTLVEVQRSSRQHLKQHVHWVGYTCISFTYPRNEVANSVTPLSLKWLIAEKEWWLQTQ